MATSLFLTDPVCKNRSTIWSRIDVFEYIWNVSGLEDFQIFIASFMSLASFQFVSCVSAICITWKVMCVCEGFFFCYGKDSCNKKCCPGNIIQSVGFLDEQHNLSVWHRLPYCNHKSLVCHVATFTAAVPCLINIQCFHYNSVFVWLEMPPGRTTVEDLLLKLKVITMKTY